MVEYALYLTKSPQGLRVYARRPYSFLEVGAGYGYWTLTAHAALRRLGELNGRPITSTDFAFTAVELDELKIPSLLDSFKLNLINASRKDIVKAALYGRADGCMPMLGIPGRLATTASNPGKFANATDVRCGRNGAIPTVTLKQLLAPYTIVDV